MRRFILLTAATATLACYAQDSTWVSLNYPEFGCSWQMPAQPTILDTLNVRMYALELDSGMAITVHFIKDVVPDTSTGSLYQAAFDVEGDTLRAMAQVMLAASNAELLALANLSLGGIPALNLAMRILDDQDEAHINLVLLLYHHGKFMSFGLRSAENRSTVCTALMSSIQSTVQPIQP